MVPKGKTGFSTKRASYESPPDPPLSTSPLNLFLRFYCPKDGGNYSRPLKHILRNNLQDNRIQNISHYLKVTSIR